MLRHIILRRQGFEGATVFKTAKVILGLNRIRGNHQKPNTDGD